MTSTYDGKEGQGCYTRFLKLKKAKMDAWTSAYEAQQKKIKEEKQWIDQNNAKPGVSSQRQQREAKLEKLLKVNFLPLLLPMAFSSSTSVVGGKQNGFIFRILSPLYRQPLHPSSPIGPISLLPLSFIFLVVRFLTHTFLYEKCTFKTNANFKKFRLPLPCHHTGRRQRRARGAPSKRQTQISVSFPAAPSGLHRGRSCCHRKIQPRVPRKHAVSGRQPTGKRRSMIFARIFSRDFVSKENCFYSFFLCLHIVWLSRPVLSGL